MNARKHLAALLGLALLTLAFLAPAAAQADFGVEPGSLSAIAAEEDGTRDFQAGSHPFKFNVGFAMNQESNGTPEGILRTLKVELPPGLIGNHEALPKCPTANFVGHASLCPGDTQIGVVRFTFSRGIEGFFPINLMRAPRGVPARFGFTIVGLNGFQEGGLRSDGDYGLTVADRSLPNAELQSITEEFWGVPAASVHDSDRVCLEGIHVVEGCASTAPPVPSSPCPLPVGNRGR